MSDKHVFFAIIGGFLFAVVGGLVAAVTGALIIHDGGDDLWGIIVLALAVLAGITGFLISVKWIRTHLKEEL